MNNKRFEVKKYIVINGEYLIIIKGNPLPCPRPRYDGKRKVWYYPGHYSKQLKELGEEMRRLREEAEVEVVNEDVVARFLFKRETNRRVDLDNLEKFAMDLLVKSGVIKDDSLIVEKHSKLIKGVGKGQGKMYIHIRPISKKMLNYDEILV